MIAEKTGYPVEMLDLDMALDADLGIDSIKRVEILSALQEQLPGAPAHPAGASRHPADPRPDRRPSRRRAPPAPSVPAAAGGGSPTQPDRRRPAGGDRREDRLPGGDARSRHGPRRRSRHRLDQAGGDPLRPAGADSRTRRRSGPSTSARCRPSARSSPISAPARRRAPAASRRPYPSLRRRRGSPRCCWR